MSDYVIIPLSATEGARVQMPLALPRDERPVYIEGLDPDVLATAERVSLPSAPPLAPSTPTED